MRLKAAAVAGDEVINGRSGGWSPSMKSCCFVIKIDDGGGTNSFRIALHSQAEAHAPGRNDFLRCHLAWRRPAPPSHLLSHGPFAPPRRHTTVLPMSLTQEQSARIEQALITKDFSSLSDADIQRFGLAPWVYWLERQAGNTDRVLALSPEWMRVPGKIGYTLVHPAAPVTIDVHHVLAPPGGARRAEGLRLTHAAIKRSVPLSIDGIDLRIPDPMDLLFFGLVLNRGWGRDRWRIKPQDYLDVQHIVQQFGLTAADLQARARALGIAQSWRVFLRRCNPFEGVLDLRGRQRLANHPLAFEVSLARERFPQATRNAIYRAGRRLRAAWHAIGITLPVLSELRRPDMMARLPCPADGPAVLDRDELQVAIRIVEALRPLIRQRQRCPADVVVRVLAQRKPPMSRPAC